MQCMHLVHVGWTRSCFNRVFTFQLFFQLVLLFGMIPFEFLINHTEARIFWRADSHDFVIVAF